MLFPQKLLAPGPQLKHPGNVNPPQADLLQGRGFTRMKLEALSSAPHRSSRSKDNPPKSLLTERCSCVILVKTAISNQRSAVSQKWE
jgi:hypothetical protein